MTPLIILVALMTPVAALRMPAKWETSGENLKRQHKLYDWDKWDELEEKYAEEEAENFEASPTLLKAWKDVFESNRLPMPEFAKQTASLPMQCANEVRVWEHAVKPHVDKVPAMTFIKAHPECRDPWEGKEMCTQAYEIPSYRLGDLIRYRKPVLPEFIDNFFPNSIGAKYNKLMNNAPAGRVGTPAAQLQKLNEVLNDDMYKDFPKPAADEVVIHLRLGDAYDFMKKGNGFYHRAANEAQKLNLTKATLVYGDHRVSQLAVLNGQSDHSNKVLKEVYKRIDEVENLYTSRGFKVTRRINYNTDCDVIYMSNAKYFVGAGGGFSYLIHNMVSMRHGKFLR